MDPSNRNLSRLKGRENYDEWKRQTRAYLVIKGLWRTIERKTSFDPTTLGETELMKYEDELDRTLSELILLVDPSIHSHIDNCTTPKAAWEILAKIFGDNGVCRKVSLLKQLVQMKLSDCASMEDYVSKMTAMAAKVKKAG